MKARGNRKKDERISTSGMSGALLRAGSVLAIRVHPEDNVAVVAADVQAGNVVRLDDGTEVRAVEAIARGSKVALSPITCGEAVIRYGEEIGQATNDIAAGQHVHTHNLRRGG